VVVVESASQTLGSKEDAMLIGFALIIVAIFLCCALLFRLSIYALPLFVAFLAGSAIYRGGSGIVAALAAAAIAAIILLAVAQLALAFAKSDLTRAVVGIAFAAPAAVAGYHAVHGIAAATMPPSAWQLVLSLLGAAIIAAASLTHWSRTRP
jgi:phosphoglycerol transferase MdoB-like AlkP superfamily enzyme